MERSAFLQRIRLAERPLAHPSATVIRGQVRFTVLTARLLRLEWSPTGIFTDDATFAFPNRYVDEPPPFAVHDDGDSLQIETEALRLNYHLGSGPLTAENLTIRFYNGIEEQVWHPGQAPTGNLGGTRRTLDDTGGEVPLELGLVSRDGWAVFDDSQGVIFPETKGWVSARPAQSLQDWYFFGHGQAYADAVAEYTRFGGAVPLIPRYVLGIWWSRYWPYRDSDLLQLATEFAEHQLPLNVLVIDMDWHTPGHWTGYTWNHELFPEPEVFLAAMHARGLRVTLNLHPAQGVHPHEAAYAEFAAALNLAATEQQPIPFRITDPQFAELYFRLLHHPLEDQGVDFWWIDWQQGENTDIDGLDPLIWLNHLHFADARRRGQRPLLFSRWGGLGNHRYPLGFSGDTFGGWATLAALPRFTATAANVGFGWWSHDIGGHFGAVEPELFVRWVQFGALSPCLRLHATKDPLGERRPWAFNPTVLEATRQAFTLRHQLIPYLYTMARHTHERGAALCRPMYYGYPEHAAAYEAHGQYLLGDDLIAAPITQPADEETGLATVMVWIPPGTWYRFDTGESLTGPRWVRVTGDLLLMPLLARAGAILPLAAGPESQQLEWRIFPDPQSSPHTVHRFRLYEDDGVSEAYLQGDYEWTTITHSASRDHEALVRILPAEGHCPALPTEREFTLTFMNVEPPEVITTGTGQRLEWQYDQAQRRLYCPLPTWPKTAMLEFSVRWAAAVRHATTMSPTPPLAHVLANTASDAAARALGCLILVPPYQSDGRPETCAATIFWRQTTPAGTTEIEQFVADISDAPILPVPFALDPLQQPQHWEVVTHFSTDAAQMISRFVGPYLNPLIQHWQVRYAGQTDWRTMSADLATRLNITDPFEIRLHPDLAPQAEARADIVLTEATMLTIDTWTNGTLSLALEVVNPEHRPDSMPSHAIDLPSAPRPTLAGLARHWPVTRWGPHPLAAGTYRITLRLTAPEGNQWLFGALLLGPDDHPLLTCHQLVEGYGIAEDAERAEDAEDRTRDAAT